MSALRHTSARQKPPFGVFLATTVVVFFCSLSAADSMGFVPYYIDGSSPSDTSDVVPLSDLPMLGDSATSTTPAPAPSAKTIVPVHIKIPAVNIDLPVQNPDTRDVDTLDNLLKNGPARYVDSATLGEVGTMIIFAHSSHLPIVHNQMFRAFNNIPNLKGGDSITIDGSDGKQYLYSVDSVVKADVNDGTTINISPSQGTKLTLVTCDTLTGKSARYILQADFVGVVGETQ
jgi:LPXTG-site transpeptidase (sortase) family protein